MDATKKIMVAVAFTEYSAELLDYAAGIADSLGAEMIVVNIINSRDVEAVGTIAAMGYEVDSKHYFVLPGYQECRTLKKAYRYKITFRLPYLRCNDRNRAVKR
jgi:hypothetical protein